MLRLRNSDPKINIAGEVRVGEPMAAHTTFRVGGPADIYVVPLTALDVRAILDFSTEHDMPLFVLGGGANILVADAGIRGLVMDMSRFSGIQTTGHGEAVVLQVGAGDPISHASAWAADHGLAGLEFIYSMPGSVAGAVWMNARCYGSEIADILAWVDVIERDGSERRYVPVSGDFGYKNSPFQSATSIMTRVGFTLETGRKDTLWSAMREHEADRRDKGHFAEPCAGSFFKNDRKFGRPTGAILDSLGLRGASRGGARVSDKHANIIVNSGSATASDILGLADHMAERAASELGMILEREVVLVGDWRTP